MTLAFSYEYGHKNGVAYFHFEQLSIISMVSLLLTFNKYTASGILCFSIHHFMFQNIISGSEHKCTSEHLRRIKKNERWKENYRRITNHFIGKYATS